MSKIIFSCFLVLISLLQIVVNLYISNIHVDIFGLTLLAIWVSYYELYLLLILLSLLADVLGQYYLGIHMLLFVFVLPVVRKYSVYLKLCDMAQQIIALQIIGLFYFFALSILDLLLQNITVSIKSIAVLFIIMPVVYYCVNKISKIDNYFIK